MTALDRIRAIVMALPDTATVSLSVAALRSWLADEEGAIVSPEGSSSWRERLWTCPPDTRLRVPDLCEALGRPKSWVYRAVSTHRGVQRLPCSRLDGELVFEAAEVRQWLRRHQQPV
jgi:predicted DNA-binding transcriptional regulator AlpA